MSKKSKLKQKQPHNIFDNVFHTLATKMPWLIIPLINLIYGLDIPCDSEIIQLRNEFYEKEGLFITDSIYLICGRIFHFECQSLADPAMAIRMFRYDTDIAVEYAGVLNGEYHLTYPDSAVIYLRSAKGSHYVALDFPCGVNTEYRTVAVNVSDYTGEDIFEKKLFLFLPFYIMRYEKVLKKNRYNKAWIDELLNEFIIIRNGLYNEFKDNHRLCNDIVELIIQISDYILVKHKYIKERMREIMGGEILELYSERMDRFEREITERSLFQKAKEIITNMLISGYPDDEIIHITGCDIDEIAQIKQNLTN